MKLYGHTKSYADISDGQIVLICDRSIKADVFVVDFVHVLQFSRLGLFIS